MDPANHLWACLLGKRPKTIRGDVANMPGVASREQNPCAAVAEKERLHFENARPGMSYEVRFHAAEPAVRRRLQEAHGVSLETLLKCVPDPEDPTVVRRLQEAHGVDFDMLTEPVRAALVGCYVALDDAMRDGHGGLATHQVPRLNARQFHRKLKEYNWSFRGRVPGYDKVRLAVEILMGLKPDDPDPIREELLTAVEKAKEACIEYHGTPGDPELRGGVAHVALGVARIGVNVGFLDGCSISELPDAIDLGEAEKATLRLLVDEKQRGQVDYAQAVHDFEEALLEFDRDRSYVQLTAQAVMTAIALLPGDTSSGILAQLNWVFCARPLIGEVAAAEEWDRLLDEEVPHADPRESRRLVERYEELNLKDLDGVRYLLALNSASMHVAVALRGLGDPNTHVDLAAHRLHLLEQGLPPKPDDKQEPVSTRERRTFARIVRAQYVSACEAFGFEDSAAQARAFWQALGERKGNDLVRLIVQHETIPEIRDSVQESAARTLPAPRRIDS